MASVLKTSIYAGLIAGTIDIGAACTINQVGPVPILRFIALRFRMSRGFSVWAWCCNG